MWVEKITVLPGRMHQRQQFGHEGAPCLRVQAGHRFVQHQQIRLRRDGPHDRQLLPLALRQLADLLVRVELPVVQQALGQRAHSSAA